MTKQEVENIVDQMSSDQLRDFAIICYIALYQIVSSLVSLFGKGFQGKP